MKESRQRWWSLGIAGVTLAAQNGVLMAFGALYLPLLADFPQGRGRVAGVQSILSLLGGLGSPLVGLFLDRLGPRRLFQGGAIVAALGLATASQVQSLPALFFTYGIVGGLGLAALGSPPNMVVAAQWFPKGRGRAIALADLGTALGAFLLVPLTQLLIHPIGWRGALIVQAGLLLILVVPANAFQKIPVGTHGSPSSPTATRNAGALRQAVRSAPFWWLVILRFVSGIGFHLVNVHVIAFAVGAGIPPLHAAAALGSVSLVSLAGRMTVGWLADRIGREVTLTFSYASEIVGVGFLFLLHTSGWPGWLTFFVLAYGLAQGSGGIISSAKAADLFSGPRFGTVFGWIALASGPGEAIGAWGGGAIFDVTGSYLTALGLSASALMVGILAIWMAGREAPPVSPAL